jgi:hypothetical protein
MAHFAHIDENNIVTQVIVVEPEVLAQGHWGDPSQWIQTSYNTRGGVHYGSGGMPDDQLALRKNYAGVGFTYDPVRDAFIPPRPWNSWLLNEDTCTWGPPVPYPTDGKPYLWNEETVTWKLVESPA